MLVTRQEVNETIVIDGYTSWTLLTAISSRQSAVLVVHSTFGMSIQLEDMMDDSSELAKVKFSPMDIPAGQGILLEWKRGQKLMFDSCFSVHFIEARHKQIRIGIEGNRALALERLRFEQ